MKIKRVPVIVWLLVLMITGYVLAQGDNGTLRALEMAEIPVRLAPELAERLGGVENAAQIVVEAAPDYELGDRLSFFVGNSDEDNIFQVEAELAAETPGVYLWVEVGVDYDAESLTDIAHQLDEDIFPYLRAHFGEEPNPGIDGDPHVYILSATNLGGIGGYFNDNSVYPQEVIATSNEHEMVVVAVDNIPFNNPTYINVLAHEFVHMTQHNQDTNEETWVGEGTAELGALLATQSRTQPYELNLAPFYFADPTIQLNDWNIDNPGGYYGGASLFFTYLVERFGQGASLVHALEQTDGIMGVDRTLETLEALDSQAGEPVSFSGLFADWVVANLLNDRRVGDGRFGYTFVDPSFKATITDQYQDYPLSITSRRVNQFGPHYLQLNSRAEQTLTVEFAGNDTIQLIPTEPRSGQHFYWANRSNQSDTRLTRAFDLRNVESATLRYWQWHEMEPFWDYGYISVSVNGGETWTVLETENTTTENPNGRAFAAGITGFSGVEGPRPAPFIGIAYDTTTGIVTDLVPGEGAEMAGVQINDRLFAINGIFFAPVDLIATLDQNRAGDTIVFTLERDNQRLDLPVTLGEHPDREVDPAIAAHWVEEVIDLTPFVDNEVVVRFEYVTDQAFVRNGWTIDDISVPEIGYFDDAEDDSGGWLLEGWVRVVNELPQDFVAQVVERVDETTVTRLLMPDEGESGRWTVRVGPSAPATLIISGMTPHTTEAATYSLTVTTTDSSN